MNANNIEDILSLSPMQQGMLYHSLLSPDSGTYIEQSTYTINGPLDVNAFRCAWEQILSRHMALRAAFLWEGLDQPVQVIYQALDLPFDYLDWRNTPGDEQPQKLEQFLEADRIKGFDLAAAPLMRLAVIRRSEQQVVLVWSHHHLLLDGWSQPILLAELAALYQGLSEGKPAHLPEPYPYSRYIAWLQGQNQARAEAAWRKEMAGFQSPSPLNVAFPDPKASGCHMMNQRLPDDASQALHQFCRSQGVTLNTIMQAAWALLLSRYTRETDIVFGATVSGRPAGLPGVERMVGLLINTLPARVQVTADMPAMDWLREIQARQAQLREFDYASLIDIQGWSEVPRDTQLFETILVFESYPVNPLDGGKIGSLQIQQGVDFSRTNYPLALAVSPGETIGLTLAYDQSRFDHETIQRMMENLVTVLEGIPSHPQATVGQLPFLAIGEQQLLQTWGEPVRPVDLSRTAVDLFIEQASQQPDAPAVAFEDQTLTYQQLDRLSNQIAHHLRAEGVQPGALVGICLETGPEMIAAMLGVMKCRAAYLPIDPAYPAERRAIMIEDSAAQLLLTQTHLTEQASKPLCPVLYLDQDDDTWAAIQQESAAALDERVQPEDLAYVIYTSGSTGKPKGVLLPHRGLSNLVQVNAELFDIRPGDRMLQFFTVSFDGSVQEIFGALTSGAMLQLARRELRTSPTELVQLINQAELTHLLMPPGLMALIQPQELHTVRNFMCGGEAMPVEAARRYAAMTGDRPLLINVYGPTEATVISNIHKVRAVTPNAVRIPIGAPIPNTQAYILDDGLHIVPIGAPGELYLGGVGLSQGYLNRPDLNAERFIPHPFHPGERLYKTGDLARWLPDGTIDCMGRLDDQVKVRGFRIELGEIEAVLGTHPAVQQAAVIAFEQGDQQRGSDKILAAYITLASNAAPVTSASLAAYLKERLPVYMVPERFMVLEALPLTPAGKIDRRQLPAPQRAGKESSLSVRRPVTPVEQGLVEIWQQVLHMEQISPLDSFFELGGHSLRAAQLVSRIREVFQIELPLRELFTCPVLADMAARISTLMAETRSQGRPPLRPSGELGPAALSFAQQRLWFLEQLAPGNLAYNLPMAVRLTGQLDVKALQNSLDEITRRHAALRTRFREQNGSPVQEILPELHITLEPVDLTGQPAEIREREALRLMAEASQNNFDLANGPLLRARLYQLSDQASIALLVMHHIIADGWSLGVLLDELSTLYRGFALGEPVVLPDLPVQYADYTAWQRSWLSGPVLDEQLNYWKDQLANLPPLLELPTDHLRPAVQSSRGAIYDFNLPADLSQEISELSQDEGVTLFMALLTAFQVLLARYSRQDDIPIGIAIANRTQTGIENLIGFFVNTLVLRARLDGSPTFREALQQVREVCLNAYAHQDLPFELLVEALQPERNLSHNPLFQVMFTMDPPLEGAFQLPGLSVSPISLHTGTATFDLTLSMVNTADGLHGSVEYNTDLWEPESITRLVENFSTLLAAVSKEPEQPIWTAPILPRAEREKLVTVWNRTNAPAPLDHCVQELFEEKARQTPNAPALTFYSLTGSQGLTYSELNERANQLAHYLQVQGVGKETLVAVSVERSLESLIAFLGILKAGGAYLPVDPTYPAERVAFMLEDSRAPLQLTQAHLVDRLPAFAGQRICLDADWTQIDQQPKENLPRLSSPGSLAYVIYTSGSTGRPKGVLLEHRGLCNLAEAQRKAFNVAENCRVLQFSPFSFDASVWEFVMALGNGAALILAPQETLASATDLLRLLQGARVTHATLPPSVLQVLPQTELPLLGVIVAAGEACPAELVTRWSPGRNFFNAYGPTETTVCASMYRCDPTESELPPIGGPLPNIQLYVCDQHMQLMPIGAPGELLVGGVSLARGYLNRPELTAEKFTSDPFKPGARLYHTGDLVRWRADGNIEFLGRIDTQVKLRGFRVELGEIEAVLLQHPQILQAAVIAHRTHQGAQLNDRLIAYLVPREPAGELAAADLRDYLRKTLPDYMIPAAFITLERLPLTPSGKIDRRNLPAPEMTLSVEAREYVAPRSETEAKLAVLCAALLNHERVGVTDNFFDLGGHSLLATQFIAHIREELGVEIPLRALFEHPTIAELAPEIEQARVAATQPAVPAIKPISREQYRRKRSELPSEPPVNEK